MAEYMNYESFRESDGQFVCGSTMKNLEKAIYLGTTSSTETWWSDRKIAEETSDDVQTVEFD
jgi:hypothetical protein